LHLPRLATYGVVVANSPGTATWHRDWGASFARVRGLERNFQADWGKQGLRAGINLIRGAKRALGLHFPGRDLEVFDDDVFLTSYPKSGKTWTRFLIANLAYPDQNPDFTNINELVPDPEALSKRRLNQMRRPRIIKTHQYYHPSYRSIIFVVRDPRDVCVSEYYFHRKRRVYADDFPIEEHVKQFVAGKSTLYGSWGENVVSWLATRANTPRFLLLRYHDMIADTLGSLQKIADFLKIEANSERLARAVERSSADNMRKLEKEQGLAWSTTKQTRQDMPFVRVAKSGGWRQELPESSVALIEQAWGPVMKYLGFELSLQLGQGDGAFETLSALARK
jgi:sulfotransferase family protein